MQHATSKISRTVESRHDSDQCTKINDDLAGNIAGRMTCEGIKSDPRKWETTHAVLPPPHCYDARSSLTLLRLWESLREYRMKD